ncbi:hypothetical protein Tco_0701105 [Tanacetum coccineum]
MHFISIETRIMRERNDAKDGKGGVGDVLWLYQFMWLYLFVMTVMCLIRLGSFMCMYGSMEYSLKLHGYVWEEGSDECDFGQTSVRSKGNITEESVNQTVVARKDIKHLDNNKNQPGTSWNNDEGRDLILLGCDDPSNMFCCPQIMEGRQSSPQQSPRARPQRQSI